MVSYARWAVGRVLAGKGDDSDARALLSKVDPLLRGRAKRKLQDGLESVLIAQPEIATGRPLLVAVAKTIGAKETDSKAPFWWASLLALLGTLGVVAAVATIVVTHEPSSAKPVFTKAPEVADAYVNGGRPISLGPIGTELFGERFGAFVIAADRHARKGTSITELELDDAQEKLIDPKFKEHVGEKVHAAIVGLAESARVTIEDGESVWGDAQELNDALAEAGLGYYIDNSSVTRREGTAPILYSHLVEKVRVFDIDDGSQERVLWLRRVDRLNRRKTATGSNHRLASVALIRRELIHRDLDEWLLPALAPGKSMRMWPVRPSEPRPPEKNQLESKLGERIREEVAAAGIPAEDLARVSTLLAEREDLLANMASTAGNAGYRVAIPSGYLFDVTRFNRLEPVVGEWLLADIASRNKELDKTENRVVYAKVRRLYVAAVEFHEVQHRLDNKRGGAPPADLHKYLKRGLDGQDMSRFGRRLTTEYSASLAEIANSKLPFATLAVLTEFSFDHKAWNSTYADVSIAVVESLCRVANIEHGPFIDGRSVVRLELARAMLKLLELPADTVRAYAKQAWESGFGATLKVPKLRKR